MKPTSARIGNSSSSSSSSTASVSKVTSLALPLAAAAITAFACGVSLRNKPPGKPAIWRRLGTNDGAGSRSSNELATSSCTAAASTATPAQVEAVSAIILLIGACPLPISKHLGFKEVSRIRAVCRGFCELSKAKLDHVRQEGVQMDLAFASLTRDPTREAGGGPDLETLMLCIQAFPELLHARDCASRTLLLKAVQEASLPATKALLAARADPNVGGGYGWTALHLAAVGRSPEMCHLLMDYGGEVNKCSVDGYAPLFYAQRAGDPEVLKALLHRGAARSSDARIFYMTPTGSDG